MDIFSHNVLLLILDSCRWDSLLKAKTPFLDDIANIKKAYSQATYTYASHMSMYQGILPSVREQIPLYNRFCLPIFRLAHKKDAKTPAVFEFPAGTIDIMAGFKAQNYMTFTIGATAWFKSEKLKQGFDKFFYTGIDAKSQLEIFKSTILNNHKQPFFGVINFGETHEPYKYGGKIKEELISRARAKSFQKFGYLTKEHEMQIASCCYLDKIISEIYHYLVSLNRKTVVIVTADHGECFGEESLYGHGFYHEKIMEVPLGLFGIHTNLVNNYANINNE